MFIRTNSTIYEIDDKEDICYDNETHAIIGYYVGEMMLVKEEQVIAKTDNDVEDLVDCFALYVDGRFKFASEDLLAIESYAIKYEFDKVEIYGMIFTRSRFNGEVGTKLIVKHDVDEKGHGYYKLINVMNITR